MGREIALGIVINLIWQFITIAYTYFFGRSTLLSSSTGLSSDVIEEKIKLLRVSVAVLAIFSFLGCVFLWLGMVSFSGLAVFLASSISLFLIQAWRTFLALRNFMARCSDVGIVGVDSEIIYGIDYEESLKQCSSYFRFLGIGASKLTSSKEFESAVVRCSASGGNDIEFLLCHPDSKALLQAMEWRAGAVEGSYRANIIGSLRVLAGLQRRQLRVKVRLYNKDNINDLPIFRIMFVSGALCYVSFQVIDPANDQGKRLPQLHVEERRRSNGMPTFFKAYSEYYRGLWEEASEIDDIQAFVEGLK